MLMRRDHPQGFKPLSDKVLVSKLYAVFDDCKSPRDGDVVVYVQGSWDMFHPAHVAILEVARKVCDSNTTKRSCHISHVCGLL